MLTTREVPAADDEPEEPPTDDDLLPQVTTGGILFGDHLRPSGVAFVRLIGERVFPLSAEAVPAEMPEHRMLEYAAELGEKLGAYRVSVDASATGKAQRTEAREHLGVDVDLFQITERITDVSAESTLRTRDLREVTAHLRYCLDHESLVRFSREHPADVALSTYQARQRRPEADEQQFEQDEHDTYVIPLAAAVDLLDPRRWSTVSIPRGPISEPDQCRMDTIGGYPAVDQRTTSEDQLWDEKNSARRAAWKATRDMGITRRQRPLW